MRETERREAAWQVRVVVEFASDGEGNTAAELRHQGMVKLNAFKADSLTVGFKGTAAL